MITDTNTGANFSKDSAVQC